MTNPKTILLLVAAVVVMAIMKCQDTRRIIKQQATIKALITERDKVPTFRELQEKLNRNGANIKVDGRICKQWNNPEHSETLTAWGKVICDQFAEELSRGYYDESQMFEP